MEQKAMTTEQLKVRVKIKQDRATRRMQKINLVAEK
jgi:hypothetical protein